MHLGVRYGRLVYNDGRLPLLDQVERMMLFSKQSGTALTKRLCVNVIYMEMLFLCYLSQFHPYNKLLCCVGVEKISMMKLTNAVEDNLYYFEGGDFKWVFSRK